MTEAVARKLAEDVAVSIAKRPITGAPIFVSTDRNSIAVRGGTSINVAGTVIDFAEALSVELTGTRIPGTDHVIVLDSGWRAPERNAIAVNRLLSVPWEQAADRPVLGGFHYAPGGSAEGRAGGDDVPAINPRSIWDVGFRPSCPDPRGMAFVASVRGSETVKPFWVDLYLLNVKHLELGTSVCGETIADGSGNRPLGADGKPQALDYPTAAKILEGHGKDLLGIDEFFAAAYGVTEKTSADEKPQLSGLDTARTSHCGMMQATGNLSIWGHDGDLDDRRPAFFGGYWNDGVWAGSRYALVPFWPDDSIEWLGARGRSDHLQLD
jgi:hypothetical protein